MVTFRNNRRGRFRSGDRNFKRNNGGTNKYKTDFSSNTSFQRKAPGRNNHNASKLIEKYNDLAREALANGDKILSENYFQHADHFTRIIEEQDKRRLTKNVESSEADEIKKNNLEEKQANEKQTINS
tara:strand:- start:127 stop:507 length:381 start_codon:yes stop_codon:yes gene_type:complete